MRKPGHDRTEENEQRRLMRAWAARSAQAARIPKATDRSVVRMIPIVNIGSRIETYVSVARVRFLDGDAR